MRNQSECSHCLSDIQILILLCILCIIGQYLIFGISIGPDSISYIDAWEENYGFLDYTRTPVYPLFLGLCKILFGNSIFQYGVVILQAILFLISAKWFYYLITNLFGSRKYSLIFSFIYIIHPSLNGWTLSILTESLSISMSVGMLYFIVKSMDGGKIYLLYTTICVFLLIFIRPSFIYILPSMLVFYLMSIKVSFMKSLIGIIGLLICTCSQLLYMELYSGRYGLFTTTRIGINNQYVIARQYGYLDPAYSPSEDFGDYINQNIKENGLQSNDLTVLCNESHNATQHYKLQDISETIKGSIIEHPEKLLISICKRLYLTGTSSAFDCPQIPLSYLSHMVGFCINSVFLLLILSIFVIIRELTTDYHNACFMILLFLMILGNIFVMMLGSFNCYGRLFVPSIPCVLVLVSMLASRIYINLKAK